MSVLYGLAIAPLQLLRNVREVPLLGHLLVPALDRPDFEIGVLSGNHHRLVDVDPGKAPKIRRDNHAALPVGRCFETHPKR